MSLTCDFRTRAGSGTLTLERTGGTFTSTTFEVQDISELGIEFTVEESSDDASNVLFSPSKFKFTVFDQLGNGNSLFKILDGLPTLEYIEVTLSFDTDGGYSWTDHFEFRKEDVEFSYEDRSLDIESFNQVESGVTSDTIFDNNPGNVWSMMQGSASRPIMGAKSFIINFFQEVYPDTDVDVRSNLFKDVILNSIDPFWSVMDFGSIAIGEPTDPNQQFYDIETNAGSMIQEMAAMDGSVVGSILGQSFFVARNSMDSPVTLSTDNVASLDVGLSTKAYRSVSLFFKGLVAGPSPVVKPWTAYGSLTGASDGLNGEGYKSLYVNFNPNFLRRAVYDSGASEYRDDGFSGVTDSDFNDGGFLEGAGTGVKKDAQSGSDEVLVKAFGAMESEADAGRLFTFDGVDSVAYTLYGNNGNLMRLDQSLQVDIDADDSVNLFKQYSGDNTGTAYPIDLSVPTEAYAYAYGAKGSRDIELEIFDIDTLKPQDAIKLDGTFSDYLSDSIYRPSKITYNILEDTIKVEAYIINV